MHHFKYDCSLLDIKYTMIYMPTLQIQLNLLTHGLHSSAHCIRDCLAIIFSIQVKSPANLFDLIREQLHLINSIHIFLTDLFVPPL